MEVHHHSHAAHGKKKWTHYFWEFIMLFLAVFCGFLAEYQLEHKIEKDREKVYIQSMIEDLQNDTLSLTEINAGLSTINNSIDTVLLYYDDMPKVANPALFRNINAITGFGVFIYNDRTIQQLKSSGGMRLIRNKNAANGIMEYDSYVRNNQNNLLYIQRFWENLNFQRISIIDQQSLDSDLKAGGSVNPEKSYLLSNDPVLLRNLKSSIYQLKLYHGFTILEYRMLKRKAMKLIDVLKKEYRLK